MKPSRALKMLLRTWLARTQSPWLLTKAARWNLLRFHSQASQDRFVYTLRSVLAHDCTPGYYLEVGAGEPIHINNSYFLEKFLHWKGISIEISPAYKDAWSEKRRNPLLIEDATKVDYAAILQSFPSVIDYLSLDVDGLYDVALRKVLESGHRFKIITIEHDAFQYGDIYKDKERDILSSHGYHLLCPDIHFDGVSFEDWWIDPQAFPSSLLLVPDLAHKSHTTVISNIVGYI